ncbi:MAG: hypothetical protein AB7I30_23170 [Isosphaeraceae bacterium]
MSGKRGVTTVLLASFSLVAIATAGDAPPPDPALERARDQVKMLDTLYKTAVVSVTNRFEGPPAIKMANDVFGAMEKGGWHRAKLIDATGAPQNERNRPQTDFERRAETAIKGGAAYFEEVSGEGSDRTLRAATVVPAVLKKCALCHGVKEGDLLGFVRYEVPVR